MYDTYTSHNKHDMMYLETTMSKTERYERYD